MTQTRPYKVSLDEHGPFITMCCIRQTLMSIERAFVTFQQVHLLQAERDLEILILCLAVGMSQLVVIGPNKD